jgi:hypothetical protein
MTNSKNVKADAKAERLAAALRANLRLRKAQARSVDVVAKTEDTNQVLGETQKK